jgi:hypothetical protein
MMNLFMKIPVLFFLSLSALHAQGTIKWQETFNEPNIPEGWQVIDADQGGSSLLLVPGITTPGGTGIVPQSGQYFWTGNVQDANLAGVIDEWLVSPRISVIYAGDSLYFWAGAVDDLFKDSLRVLISTSNDMPSSFVYELGHFKVDGPAGSWHRYGFDLSEFDSSDIYIAINYYIVDGGPGGQSSDFVWIDHPLISGDPSTLNHAPTLVQILEPADQGFIDTQANTVDFRWSASHDEDAEQLHYTLSIVNVFPPLRFSGLTDTTYSLEWKDVLNENADYRWTIEVTDGKSHVAALDTFTFKLADPAGILDNSSALPGQIALSQNYPNPFNPETTIDFNLPESQYTELTIYNMLGEKVSTLVAGHLKAGDYSYRFNAADLASGVYYYQLRAGDFREVKKMVVLK